VSPEETFKENGISGSDLEDLLTFPFSEGVADLSPDFFGILRRIFPLLTEVYPLDTRRNVNEGLYLRHILRVMVVADGFYRQLREKGIYLNYDVLMTAAALHDAIEINRENGREVNEKYLQQKLREIGFSKPDAYNISHMARFLISQKYPHLSYFKQKKQDFDRVWEGRGLKGVKKKWREACNNAFYLKIIKAADVLANLEETVDDLRNGRDDGKMKHSLTERYDVFKYRIGRIREIFVYKNAD